MNQEDESHMVTEDVSMCESEKIIAATIARAHGDIKPIVSILNNARIRDEAGAAIRQLHFSVTEFMNKYPEVTVQNSRQWEMKIRNARCFFMILQQIKHPRDVRNFFYIYACEYIYPSILIY